MEEKIQKIIDSKLNRAKEIVNIPGQSFYSFFKDLKFYEKMVKSNEPDNDNNNAFIKEIRNINKSNIIIFSPNPDKIDNIKIGEEKMIFPFENIYFEYPFISLFSDETKPNGIYMKTATGFLVNAIKRDDGTIAGFTVAFIWNDFLKNENDQYENGVEPKFITLPPNCLDGEVEIHLANKENSNIAKDVINNLRRMCILIQKNEYDEYYKWSPSGILPKKIVYAQSVKAHKKHFWKDTGFYKIPNMSRDEIESRGYGIDECVFRGYELRRDVPYVLISDRNNRKINDDNKIIKKLRGRTWKNEEKLGTILAKIFPNEYIKRHDRKQINPLELDYYIHRLRLAFEYDGEQHYDKNVCENIFHSNFEAQKSRDIKKNALCRRKKINLIRVKYDEPLNISNIRSKISKYV